MSHQLGAFQQQKFNVSQPEGQKSESQVSVGLLLPEAVGENQLQASPSFRRFADSPWRTLACRWSPHLCLHLHAVSPLCVSLCAQFSLSIRTHSYWIRAHPSDPVLTPSSQWLHFWIRSQSQVLVATAPMSFVEHTIQLTAASVDDTCWGQLWPWWLQNGNLSNDLSLNMYELVFGGGRFRYCNW